jgi:hypothetical protein
VGTKIQQGNDKVRAQRGISLEVWNARPYTWWKPSDLTPIEEAYAGLTRPQVSFMKKLARQHPGSVAQSTGSGSSRPVCLLLAGISTFGTLAAARFALDLSCVKSMREKLIANGGRDLPYFIAIISSTPNAQYTGVDMSSTQLIDVQPVARGLKA